ncbi:MAG: S-layer homology domain-containing protein [Candidatus Peribacteraceae bacterium]|nr:S-layer homology domain-containing protein [Candidatus Peribacteraceae bacterium]
MQKQTHPRHIQFGAIVLSQLMLVFAALMVYPYLFDAKQDVQTHAGSPPQITSNTVTNITFNSATINWTTNVPTTGSVAYDRTTRFALGPASDATLQTSHSVVLTGLEMDSWYSYAITAVDSAGATTKIQDDLKFQTLVDTTQPFDFLVDVGPISHVTQGYTSYLRASLRRTGGSSFPITTFSFQNVPSGVTVSFFQNYYNTVSMKVTAAPTAQPGSYNFQLTVMAGSKSHTVNMPLIVDPVPAVVTPQAYQSPPPAIPQIALWESNMKKYGTKFCNQADIISMGMWDGSVWFYDGTRAYYQMADYLNDPVWGTTCAQYVETVFRKHVLDNNGVITGYRVFPRGALLDWQKSGDTESKRAIDLMAKNAAFSNVPWAVLGDSYSREAAYALDAKIDTETAGNGPNQYLQAYADIVLGHMEQWFTANRYTRIAPFMFALSADSLIDYYEKTKDPRVLPAIQKGADYLWDNLWVPGNESFCYQILMDGKKCKAGSPDLNLLIVYPYGWLYKMTGDPKYLTRGDQIFAGGVKGAWLEQGKQFAQNYRLSFEYVHWRKTLGADLHGAPPSTSSSSSVASSLSSSSSSSASSVSSSSASSVMQSPSSASSIASSIALSSSSTSIPFVQASSSTSSLPTGSVSSWSRSSLSSSSNEKALREKALADYLASQAQKSSQTSASPSQQPLTLKKPIELTSSSGFLVKTVNSTQIVFKDVFITDYFAPAVDLLVDLGIVSGYNDENGKPLGLYRPSRDVQHAEVAKILAQLMNLPGSTPVNTSAQNTWAASFVAALEAKSPSLYTKDLNVFTPMTRLQVIHAMADTLAITANPNVGSFFSDTKDPLINTFKGMGIVKGNPDGTFRPDSPINRAEVATLLGRLLEQGYGQ